MKLILNVLVFIVTVIVWGCLLCIGFWCGRKITDRFDLWLTRRTADKCAKQMEEDITGRRGIF